MKTELLPVLLTTVLFTSVCTQYSSDISDENANLQYENKDIALHPEDNGEPEYPTRSSRYLSDKNNVHVPGHKEEKSTEENAYDDNPLAPADDGDKGQQEPSQVEYDDYDQPEDAADVTDRPQYYVDNSIPENAPVHRFDNTARLVQWVKKAWDSYYADPNYA